MLLLSGNCRAGKFSVSPSNWKSSTANPKLMWRISYWFFDDNLNKKKKIVIKGLNHLKVLRDKQSAVKVIIDNEIDILVNQHWNHITKAPTPFVPEPGSDYIIDPQTPFLQALKEAVKHLEVKDTTKRNAGYAVDKISPSAAQLKLAEKPIGEIRRRHIISILKDCRNKNPGMSDNTYNAYRSYLMMIFRIFVEIETVDFNPVRDISKLTGVHKIRETLTHEERKLISDHLMSNHYAFWRYAQIFFHSGSRTSELFRLKVKDVDLARQRFKLLIMKRKKPTEVWRPIKDIALTFWTELMTNAKADQFVFSKGLVPGDRPIRDDQITKRWYKHVKKKLKITADFYSLKHTNLDETAEALSIIDAQKMAGHTTPVITLDYAKGEKERQNERLRKVNNSFA